MHKPSTQTHEVARATRPASIRKPESFGPEIPLHTLCKTCTSFAQTCEDLDTLQFEDTSIGHRISDVETKYDLCTVQQLREGGPECHLCTLVVTALTQYGIDPSDLSPGEMVRFILRPHDKPITAKLEYGVDNGYRHIAFDIRATVGMSS